MDENDLFDKNSSFKYTAKMSNWSKNSRLGINRTFETPTPQSNISVMSLKANSAEWVMRGRKKKLFPEKFPKLMRSTNKQCESPGVGTYWPNVFKKHSFKAMIMKSPTWEPIKSLTNSYVDTLPLRKDNNIGQRNNAIRFGTQVPRKYLEETGQYIERRDKRRRELREKREKGGD